MPPMASPWLSPNVVSVKSAPNVLRISVYARSGIRDCGRDDGARSHNLPLLRGCDGDARNRNCNLLLRAYCS